MPDGVVDLTSSSFDDAISGGDVWLVDFWAEWCGPCHALGPVLEGLAAQGRDGLQVGKLDVSQHAEIGERFEIKSLPTIVIFRNGEPVSRLFGVKTLRQLGVALDRVAAA